jgi:hypothetical protein
MAMLKFIKKYFVLIVLFFISLSFLIHSLINHSQLNGQYAYVIGKVIKKEPYKSGGVIYTYYYSYKGIKNEGRNTDVFWHKDVNDLFYIKVLFKDDFVIGDIKFIDDRLVPYCLTMDSVPSEGWKDLPHDTCKY